MPDTADQAALRARSEELMAVVAAGGPDRAAAREALALLHRPLVEHCVRRFRGRGADHEDLVQVGMVALLLAIDRFDPARGLQFTSFAAPTIRGEVRRWFRDKGWAVRVPRRLQELRARVSTLSAELVQELGRSPTTAELATAVGCTVAEVLECCESAQAYATTSLDAQDGDPGAPPARSTLLAREDDALADVVVRESVRPLLERLPPREKRILLLRFYAGLTQSQIAAETGLTQMQVSRVLSRTLADLRAALDLPPDAGAVRPGSGLRSRGPAAPPRRGGPPRAPPRRR
ncbi:SigB/SigF/SigG family RNA polymerase sigma factor [Nocardioides sp. AX2bis]|uniref:SigB/SigF/SigG family RNA polymerase sigma factor n=1 Tax=Nocardioides sp. AX2bis TaxID=2653157 RepID=UPI0012F3EAD8|nr:SigB/SigF/SigG family RNA polymerase sigma factor [Nocardioides sp. AX2bis]VXB19444.1 RNA polymerase sigma-F factor [Nocardioides sp. AX2bis]